MARKKGDSGSVEESKAGKRAAPSVTTFLSKISTPKGAAGGTSNSPAKDLLGGVTRGDLAALENSGPRHVEPLTGAALEIEINADLAAPGARGGRKQERVAWQGVVDVRGVFAEPAGGAEGHTRASNVSAGGVFVETAHLLEVGDPVVLSFPGDNGKRVVVSGRVRWVTPFGRIDDPTPGMGIEFVGLDQIKRDKIDALLSRVRN